MPVSTSSDGAETRRKSKFVIDHEIWDLGKLCDEYKGNIEVTCP